MATYVFENMTQDQANTLTVNDVLAFSTQSVSAFNLVLSTNSASSQISITTVTVGTKSLSFDSAALQTVVNRGNFAFFDGFQIRAQFVPGNDTINGGDFAERIEGGAGNDVIFGANGADHIVGGPGQDLMSGGSGIDTFRFAVGDAAFVNNAGTFSVDVIQDFQDGTDLIHLPSNVANAVGDVLVGGVGATITTVSDAMTYAQSLLDGHSGGTDVAAIRVGSDTYLFYNDTGNGPINSIIRLVGIDPSKISKDDFGYYWTIPATPPADTTTGGQGNDTIQGGSGPETLRGLGGNDVINGGAGNDTIYGGVGQDTLSGGQNADVFSYAAGDASYISSGNNYTTETILGFEAGIDKIQLNANIGSSPGEVVQNGSGSGIDSLSLAQLYAQQLLDNHAGTTDVAAVKVGADTYLFYNDAGGGVINSIIRLVGISPTQIASTDFLTQSGTVITPPPVDPFAGSDGNDNIIGNALDNVISGLAGHDNLFGGGGNDRLDGGDGNDHLYGFDITGDPTTDGNDTIRGGAGNDYVQGNAGDDVLYGDDGSDRLNGGAGDDVILGGEGNDSINGNKGEDTISAGAGNDSVRGGQGDDEINGDQGNDILFGDLGNDVIFGGAGQDMVTGGQGNDIFAFFAGHAAYVNDGGAFTVDVVLDFQDGADQFRLNSGIGTAAGDVLHDAAGVVFTSVSTALARAQQLLDGHAGVLDVAVLQVGSDSYMFYNDANGATVNAIVRLTGIAQDQISSADFVI